MEPFENEITLTAGQWQAKVLPGFGMNLISLRRNESPILREPADEQVLMENPYVYGVPLLLPANRTAGGRFEFEGKMYQIPINEPAFSNHIHGLLYNAPFEVLQQTGDSVTAAYENYGDRYPFPFVMIITDTLSEAGLHRRLELKNTGDTAMPFTLAFHTAFTEPAVFSVPLGKRAERDNNYIPTGKLEALSETEKEYLTEASSNGRAISGFYTAAGHRAMLDDTLFEVSENFDQWILFNGGGEQGFLCIEPQCGQVNGLNMPDGHHVLQPGEIEIFTFTIKKENTNEDYRY